MKFLFLCVLSLSLLYGEEPAKEEDNSYDPHLVVTHHTIELPKGPLSYTATTGFCPIVQGTSKIAQLFFIAYTKDDEENRPITFVFPGGPGGAGTIEALLTFGPRRLVTAKEGRTILPPYKIIDNPETILEYTDLVFIDPPKCGFSQISEEAKPSSFFSVDGDIYVLGTFIHTFLDYTHRWNSPIYLAGGSYGTVRCTGLAAHLFHYGIATTGLILNGCALEYATHQSDRDRPLPDALIIPTFAATAWYHKRLWPEKSLPQVLDYARRFAYDEYIPVMLQPSRLSHVEKVLFEQKLAELIGLPVDTVKRYASRINEKIYAAEFFGAQRKVLGRLDTRYFSDISTIDPDSSHDPSYLDSLGCLPAFNAYLQKELNTHFPLTKYVLFCWQALVQWDFNTFDSKGEVSFLQRLRHTLVINPLMKVFIASGYYDCRTPFAATEYCFDQLDLPPSYRKNLHFSYYDAGHAFMLDHDSLVKWKQDLTDFYNK